MCHPFSKEEEEEEWGEGTEAERWLKCRAKGLIPISGSLGPYSEHTLGVESQHCGSLVMLLYHSHASVYSAGRCGKSTQPISLDNRCNVLCKCKS